MSANEAEGHMKAAYKALKTNVWTLKFKPDYEIAALEFSDAAKCFQACGQRQRATEALHEFANTRKLEGDMFGAGRGYENVANCQINHLGDYPKGCDDLSAAAECYVLAGKLDSACRVWMKIAEIQEEKAHNIDAACHAYKKAIEISDIEEKDHNSLDFLKAYVSFLARNLRSHESIGGLYEPLNQLGQIQRKLNHSAAFPKTVLSKVVLRLMQNDSVGAKNEIEDALSMVPGCIGNREIGVANRLVCAWESGNVEEFKSVTQSSAITYLPVEFAKLAKQLRPPSQPLPFEGGDSGARSMDVAEMLM